MDAREYVDLLKDDNGIIRLAHFTEDNCDGRAEAIVIDEEHQIAVLVTDCGFVATTNLPRGAVVKFTTHPEAEPKITGQPAFVQEISVVVLEDGHAKSIICK